MKKGDTVYGVFGKNVTIVGDIESIDENEIRIYVENGGYTLRIVVDNIIEGGYNAKIEAFKKSQNL